MKNSEEVEFENLYLTFQDIVGLTEKVATIELTKLTTPDELKVNLAVVQAWLMSSPFQQEADFDHFALLILYVASLVCKNTKIYKESLSTSIESEEFLN